MRVSVLARIAVLSAGGAVDVFDLESTGDLRPVLGTLSSLQQTGSRRSPPDPAEGADRIASVAWLALPEPVGGGSVLVARAADGGAMYLLDALPRSGASTAFDGRGAQVGSIMCYGRSDTTKAAAQ